MKKKFLTIISMLIGAFAAFSQTYTLADNLEILKAGNPNNFVAGDVLLKKDAIKVDGVSYDALFTILGVNLRGQGRFLLRTPNPNSTTFGFDNVRPELDPAVRYNLKIVKSGSATPSNLTGAPVNIANLTIFLPDIDGTGTGDPTRMYVDMGGYAVPTGGIAPVVTAGSALSVQNFFNLPTAYPNFTKYRAEVPSPDVSDNNLTDGTFLTSNPYVLRMDFSNFTIEGINLMFGVTSDPTKVTQTQGNANRSFFHVFGVNANTVLPVTFDNLQAVVKANQLLVNWSTLTETNNDHFIIEVSKDGKNWKELATVKSLAPEGNSSQKIDYDYQVPLGAAAGLFGIPALLAIGLTGFSRRRKIIAGAAIIVFMAFAWSCNKSEVPGISDSQKIWVRIAQADKDGATKYSKVVQAVKE